MTTQDYGPFEVQKKAIPVEAMQLLAGIIPEAGEVLDPNTAAHARLAGWMFAHGFKGFRVVGNRSPFGLELDTYIGPVTAAPGDWIVRDKNGVFYPVQAADYDAWFEARP